MCFFAHIATLMELQDKDSVPEDPSEQDLKDFNGLHGHNRQIISVLNEGMPKLNTRMKEVNAQRLASMQARSRMAQRSRKLDESHLRMILAMMAIYGLDKWRPDLRSHTTRSLWNAAHRIIAIQSFQQCCLAGAYQASNPAFMFVQNDEVLTKWYDHYVFFYKKGHWDKEKAKPGSVASISAREAARERRRNVSYCFRLQKSADSFFSSALSCSS